jgi:hypothetical protein
LQLNDVAGIDSVGSGDDHIFTGQYASHNNKGLAERREQVKDARQVCRTWRPSYAFWEPDAGIIDLDRDAEIGEAERVEIRPGSGRVRRRDCDTVRYTINTMKR